MGIRENILPADVWKCICRVFLLRIGSFGRGCISRHRPRDVAMKSLIWMVCALALSALTGGASLYAADNSKEINRIRAAKEVFQELMETPDRAIPRELLESASASPLFRD